MSGKHLVFMDDARLLPDLSGNPDALVVSLDSHALSELQGRPGLQGRSIGEYAGRSFASYDELYACFEAEMRERFRPKDPQLQSRFLFEVFWDDILLNLIRVHYLETVVRAVLDRERPASVDFAIADRELDALFRRIVHHRP